MFYSSWTTDSKTRPKIFTADICSCMDLYRRKTNKARQRYLPAHPCMHLLKLDETQQMHQMGRNQGCGRCILNISCTEKRKNTWKQTMWREGGAQQRPATPVKFIPTAVPTAASGRAETPRLWGTERSSAVNIDNFMQRRCISKAGNTAM